MFATSQSYLHCGIVPALPGAGHLRAWRLACGCSVREALIIGNNHMGSKTVMQWRKRLALSIQHM